MIVMKFTRMEILKDARGRFYVASISTPQPSGEEYVQQVSATFIQEENAKSYMALIQEHSNRPQYN